MFRHRWGVIGTLVASYRPHQGSPAGVEPTAPTSGRQSALGGQQVTQSQQQRQTLGVLGQTPVADFGITEQLLHLQEGMLHPALMDALRFSVKAALLPGSSCRRRPGFIATCQSNANSRFSHLFSTPTTQHPPIPATLRRAATGGLRSRHARWPGSAKLGTTPVSASTPICTFIPK